MKLMKNVANRDHSPTRSPPKPSGPSVAGARSSKTRIVIAMAKTPSIRVSRRFFGSPCALGLGASARLHPPPPPPPPAPPPPTPPPPRRAPPPPLRHTRRARARRRPPPHTARAARS